MITAIFRVSKLLGFLWLQILAGENGNQILAWTGKQSSVICEHVIHKFACSNCAKFRKADSSLHFHSSKFDTYTCAIIICIVKLVSFIVIFLSFRTDRSGQTVQTLEEQSDQGLHCYNSLCIFWMRYSKETPSCSTFRVITTNVLGVRIFRKFTVAPVAYYWSFLII